MTLWFILAAAAIVVAYLASLVPAGSDASGPAPPQPPNFAGYWPPVDTQGGVLAPDSVLKWTNLANKYAQINSILDPEDILAIVWNESYGNPAASNLNDPSWGLMGVTALIAGAYGGFDSSDTSWHEDPDKNMRAGSGFLAHLKARFSDQYPDTWSDAYNEGETRLSQGVVLTPGYSAAFRSHVKDLKGAV